ncbi:hypothetical protein IW261DRAFT_1637164 [Armillaria novae-zelandiae]|uniref:Integral membrane protein n=1 Tax=Armillaria novae-zelandiae TaxID=153914 RepID=A0AA39P395_9AGAR|nr:hypothetical protein IW261DRAFT_1637164 [Armillaria novae-zelandiae]
MSDSHTFDIGFKTEKPFELLYVSRGDSILGSIVFGFFFGFSIHVAWRAALETKRASRVRFLVDLSAGSNIQHLLQVSAYIIMIWLEILANTTYAVSLYRILITDNLKYSYVLSGKIVAWCYLQKIINPSIGVFLTCVICWIVQVQCLMLIIVNRLCILIQKPSQRLTLKLVVIGVVSVVSISTSCIWIPAELQINSSYMSLNRWWDKFEKSIYLLLDLALNILFIRMVKGRLVDHGLKKYDRGHARIIIVSIGMDVLLMGATTLKNPFVYTQFHPVTYIVKLQIEMSMSRLLIKVAHSTGINVYNEEKAAYTSDNITVSGQTGQRTQGGAMAVNITTQIYTQHDVEGQEEYELSNTFQKDRTIGDDRSLNSPSVNKIADDELSPV